MSQPVQFNISDVSPPKLSHSRPPSPIHAAVPISNPTTVRRITLITQDNRATLQQIEELLKMVDLKDSEVPPYIEEIPNGLALGDYFSPDIISEFPREDSLEGHAFYGFLIYFQSVDSARRAFELLESVVDGIGAPRSFIEIRIRNPSVATAPPAPNEVDGESDFTFTDWIRLWFANFNFMQILGSIMCRTSGALPHGAQETFICDIPPTVAGFGQRFFFLPWTTQNVVGGGQPTDLLDAFEKFDCNARLFDIHRAKDAYVNVKARLSAWASKSVESAQALYARFIDETRGRAPSFTEFHGFPSSPAFASLNLKQILEVVVCCATGGIPYDPELILFCDVLPQITWLGNSLFSQTWRALSRARLFVVHRAADAYGVLQVQTICLSQSVSNFLNFKRETIESQKREIQQLLSTRNTLRRALLYEIKGKTAQSKAFQKAIDKAETQRLELRELYRALRQEQKQDSRAITSLRAELDLKYQYFKDRLNTINEKILTKFQSFESSVYQLREEHGAKIRARDDRIRELESVNVALKADNAKAKEEVGALRFELVNAQRLRQVSDSAVEENKKYSDTLKRTVLRLQHRSDALENEAEKKEVSNKAMVKECERLQERCEALRKQNSFHRAGLVVYLVILGGMVLFLFF